MEGHRVLFSGSGSGSCFVLWFCFCSVFLLLVVVWSQAQSLSPGSGFVLWFCFFFSMFLFHELSSLSCSDLEAAVATRGQWLTGCVSQFGSCDVQEPESSGIQAGQGI